MALFCVLFKGFEHRTRRLFVRLVVIIRLKIDKTHELVGVAVFVTSMDLGPSGVRSPRRLGDDTE